MKFKLVTLRKYLLRWSRPLPPPKLLTFQRRADWGFRWSSSGYSEFSEEAPLFSLGSTDKQTNKTIVTKVNTILSDVEKSNMCCVGDILQRSLYQHGTDPSAPTSCRLCFGSAPVRLYATKMTLKQTNKLKFGGLTLLQLFIGPQRLREDAATLLFEESTSRFSFSHMSFEDFSDPFRLSYSL